MLNINASDAPMNLNCPYSIAPISVTPLTNACDAVAFIFSGITTKKILKSGDATKDSGV